MLDTTLINELQTTMGLTPEKNWDENKPGVTMMSAYVGRQPNGEPRFLASVADFGDGLHWDIIRLDKWGGIGSRRAWKSGTLLLHLHYHLDAIDKRDGHVRLSSAQYLNI